MYSGIRSSFRSSRRTSCQSHQNLRAETGPADTAVTGKLFGLWENLQRTAAYVPAFGATEGLAVKIHQILRAENGHADTAVMGKLFGPVENLSVQRHTSQLPMYPEDWLSRSTRI